MKLLKYTSMALFSCLLAFSCTSEKEELGKHHFDNKLFINAQSTDDDILFKPSAKTESAERTLSIGLALKAETRIQAKFVVAPELLARYRMAFNAPDAQGFPEENVEIENPEVTIEQGAVQSTNATVKFNNINLLDRNISYVLPVQLVNITGVDPLESKTIAYFVFKGAATINVVADVADNYFPIKWESDVSSIKTITVETLVRARSWDPVEGKDDALSSLFGIEGNFLLRVGDADRTSGEAQLVNPNGNWPGPNADLALPVNKWVHIAVVWDGATGERIMYHDGVRVAKDEKASGTLNIESGCYIGRSWNDERWVNGELAEMRIWTVQRTQEEIASNMYEVDPDSDGLLAYWKFNEGAGKTIVDHSGNGNDIEAVNDLGWTRVALPEL